MKSQVLQLKNTAEKLEDEVRQIQLKLINSNESSSLIKQLQEYQLKAKEIESTKHELTSLQAQM